MRWCAFVAALWLLQSTIHGALAAGLCLGGCPVGAPADNTIIERRIYILSNNPHTKFADWVAYRVAKSTIGPSQTRTWKADPELAPEDTLEPADYTGANAALGVARGHQAPLAALSGTQNWRDTNYLSNITPQRENLNSGPWEKLEAAEIRLAKRAGVSPVYVVTGPLYERDAGVLPNADEDHTIPSGYWKVVAVKRGSEYAAAAFLMHQDTPRTGKHCPYAVLGREVEERTGLNLFPDLPSGVQEALEAAPSTLLRDLGC